MAFIQLDFLSKYLNMHTAVNIALPMPADVSAPMEDIPCLVLLHDAGDDMTSWQRNVPVERYAIEYGIAIVMPDGALSFYENMRHGGQYADYIAKELPELLRAYLPLSKKKDKNFIAGCGMGGAGALKIALGNPGNYCAAGVFSASHIEMDAKNENLKSALLRAYGEDSGSCRRFIEEKAAEVKDISIRHICAADGMPENAGITRAFFENSAGNIDYRFETLPGRDNWAVREKMLARFLGQLDLPAPEVLLK